MRGNICFIFATIRFCSGKGRRSSSLSLRNSIRDVLLTPPTGNFRRRIMAHETASLRLIGRQPSGQAVLIG